MLADMKKTLPLCLIAALAQNRVIGRDNQLPWHLPADLRHFKALTLGKPVLMGRRTAQSLRRALPGRRNLVLSRSGHAPHAGMEVFVSLPDALAALGDAPEACVIGGGAVFARATGIRSTRSRYARTLSPAIREFFTPVTSPTCRSVPVAGFASIFVSRSNACDLSVLR